MVTWHILPCDAMLSRYMLSTCVCVCLSVTRRYCVKTAKCRITQTMLHESPVTLVCWSQKSWRNWNGVTPNEGMKCRLGRYGMKGENKVIGLCILLNCDIANEWPVLTPKSPMYLNFGPSFTSLKCVMLGTSNLVCRLIILSINLCMTDSLQMGCSRDASLWISMNKWQYLVTMDD